MYTYYQYPNGLCRVVWTSADNLSNNHNDIDKNKKGFTTKEEVERISLSRTKRHISDICLSNNFNYFVTLTVSDKNCNRFDIDECEALLRKLLKSYKRKHKDFIYILIAELHDKGGYHFHGLFGGIDKNDLTLVTREKFPRIPYKILWYIDHGIPIYHFDLFENNMGWTTVSEINDTNRVSNYIKKYITKDCVRNSCGSVYICSRGLSHGTSYTLSNFDIYGFMRYQNDNNIYCRYYDDKKHCKLLEFNIDDLPLDIKLDFEKYIKDKNSIAFPSFIHSYVRSLHRI